MPDDRKKSSTARPNSPAAKRAGEALRKKAQKELDRLSRRTVTKKAAPKKTLKGRSVMQPIRGEAKKAAPKKKSAARKAKSRSYR